MILATEILHDPKVLELLPTAVYVVDAEGLIRGYNSKACALWGQTPKLLSPDHKFCGAFKLLLPDGTPITSQSSLMAAAVQTGKVFTNEPVTIVRPDGSKISVLLNISPLRDEIGKIIGAINAFQDISGQMDFKREMENQQTQHLEKEHQSDLQSQKTTTKHAGDMKERNLKIDNLEDERDLREKFVDTLTHDLRTPMTAIKMIAQLLMRNAHDPASVRNACTRIVVNTDRADRMIRDMLDVNRLKVGESIPLILEECQLDQLIAKIHEELVVLHGSRFHIQGTLTPVTAVVDSEGVRRMIENLAGNAVKYGAIDSPIAIGLHHDADWAEIVVHNVGKLISAEDQLTLFQAYKRTASAKTGGQRGWGIGLTVVDGIAKAHGGKAWIVSNEKQGTNFYIRLPLQRNKVALN